MTFLTRLCGFAFLVSTLAFAACGSIDSPDSKGQPISSIRGRITNVEQGLEIINLRAALLWLVDDETRIIAEDVPIVLDAALPVRFQVDLFLPPPEEAMLPGHDLVSEWDEDGSLPDTWGKDFRFAYSLFVVYDDRNGNGKLDMLSKDAPEAIDALLGPMGGSFEELMVLFVEGDPRELNEAMAATDEIDAGVVVPGLNVFADAENGGWWDMSKPIDMELSYDPEWQDLMCEKMPENTYISSPWNKDEPDAPVPFGETPEGAEFACSEDGRSLDFWWSYIANDDGKPCTDKPFVERYGSCELGDGPIPDGWPCTVTN